MKYISSVVVLVAVLFFIYIDPTVTMEDPNQLQQMFTNTTQNQNTSIVINDMFAFLFQQFANLLEPNGTIGVQTVLSNLLNTNANFMDTLNGALNSSEIQQAIELGATALDIYVQQNLGTFGVSHSCYNDVKMVVSGVTEGKDWALRMLDAFGKPGSDLLNFQTKWIGSYDECVALQSKNNYQAINGWSAVPDEFSAKYCTISFGLEQGALPIAPHIEIGTCWPDSCSAVDIKGLLTTAFFVLNQTEMSEKPDVKCQEEKSFDTGAVVAICFLFLLGFLILLGTLYDALTVQMKRCPDDDKELKYKTAKKDGVSNGTFVGELGLSMSPIEQWEINATADELPEDEVKHTEKSRETESKGMVEKIVLSFSVYTNGVKILSTKQSAGSLGAVNGIRFLSMAWVILGHTYYFAASYTGNVFQFFGEQMYYWPFMGILYAGVSVDTFFALSGLLVAYLTLKELKKVGGITRFNWFMFFFHRFWRLTPVYMLVLLVYTTLVKYLGSGPMWTQEALALDNCAKSWWTNLLYINNFVKVEESCIGWTWYLANDMQFYVLSPLIVIPLFYQVIVGGLVSLLFLVATVTATAIIVMNHHYPAQSVYGVPPPNDGDYMKNVYFPCYTRMGPYIIGLLTGYLLYRTNCKIHMPKIVALLGWLICLGIVTSVIYGCYTDKDGSHIFSDEESIVYHSLSRTGWGIAVCWIVFACATGYGGWINELLSWKAFIPLGRLTYCAYLVHPIVQFHYYMNRRNVLFFNIYEVIYLFLPHLVIAYGVAFITSLAFESPMMGLEKAIFKRDRRS